MNKKTRSQGPGIVLLKPWRYTSPRAQLSGVRLVQSNALRKTLVSPYFKVGHRTKHEQKNPATRAGYYFVKALAVSYFHMGRPHTIIGAEQFHFRVRDGIGWFTLAMAARKTVM